MLAAFMTLAAWAAPRSRQEMHRAAARVLGTTISFDGKTCDIRLVKTLSGLTVMGNDSAFAVIATDDAFPDVLGYSTSSFETAVANPHFNWWLRAAEQMVAEPSAVHHMVAPDTEKYADHVDPLIQTHWGQESPYNMYCPNRFPTGCVATATAQVLRYNEWPESGQGTVFTYVPFGDYDGTRYEETLGERYEYSKMSNRYADLRMRDNGSEVAKLMYHIGLSIKSIYEFGGTGAYSETLCHGLRNNMGYPYAVSLDRDHYTEEEWMDMIFASLNAGIPIIYGGSDESYTGHEFVLDGYDSNGKIHINWGWSGEADGFFDMTPLMVYHFYDFSMYQDMVVRCSTDWLRADTVVVDVAAPGTLGEQLGVTPDVVCLKVRGAINGTDLKVLRALAGCDADGHGTHGQLSVLDLSEAAIVAGGEPYLKEDGAELTTNDGEMPYKAFSQCSMLIDVVLPEGLRSYGGAVFAACNNLDRVVLRPGSDSDFIVENGFVLSADRQRLIECLPDGSAAIQYVIPDGVSEVGDYAFSGRFLYERLTIPESVKHIGAYAFNRCFNLARTYVFNIVPPAIDPSAVDELDISLRKLYVPKGSLFKYHTADGWEKYKRNIMEFDKTDVRAPEWATTAPSAIYDLQGRVVGWGTDCRHLSPGIYVVNGRKVIQ